MQVNQTTGAILATDTTTNTFDANRDPVSSSDSASGSVSSDTTKPVTHTTTDDAGRVTKEWTTLGDSGATISETDTQFDPDGNAIFITSSVSQPGGGSMRVTYVGNWYDSDSRLTTTVNYGTNGGTSMSSRPTDPPSRSTTPSAPQVTSYTYTPEGYVDTATDPRGIVAKKYYDELGNVTKTIANFQADGTPSADAPDVNQTTELTYNSDNQLVDQTAVNPGGVNQTTRNLYGPSGPNQDKGLLLAVQYPDLATGQPSSSQQVTYTYNSDGTVATMTDRDGTTHAYKYDDAGHQIADVVTTLGTGVDGSVMERDTSYNDLGQPVTYTAKNAAGTVLSQVGETYDGNGQTIAESQSHDGAVTSDTPTVGYGYQETAGGQDRQTSLTYPDGRQITLSYGDSGSLTDAEGWIYSIADANHFGDHTLANFSYMGDGTLVGQSRPQTGANEAITLDSFGNIADLNWTNSASTSTDHFGLGYDADGNVLHKQDYVTTADSELYHANGATPGYDGLNRLTTFSRGTLSASGSTLDTISSDSASTTQSWTLDTLGNQQAVTTNGATQSKTQNAQNQTTSVGGAGLTYDANGATTTDEQGRHWKYDAWGDPVSVNDASGNPIETDGFDALGRRITVTTYSGGSSPTTTDLYYSTAGQVLEKDQSGSVVSQTVYSVGYVNSVIEIDQATGSPGTLDQRIYVQQDANHNLTSVTDTSGTVLERYIYSPYGTQTVLNPDGTVKGDGTPASSSYNLPVGFQGMLFDPVLSDNLTPNRVYDPMLGTWTSEDPAGYSGSGDNLYQSEAGRPATTVDPTGMAGEEDEDGKEDDADRLDELLRESLARGVRDAEAEEEATQESASEAVRARARDLVVRALNGGLTLDEMAELRDTLMRHGGFEETVREAYESLPRGTETEAEAEKRVAQMIQDATPTTSARSSPASLLDELRAQEDAPAAAMRAARLLPETGGVALGKDIAGRGMKELAEQTNSSWYRNWAKDGITRRTVTNNFGRAFHDAVQRATVIRFSLDGIDDIPAALSAGRAGFVEDNMTNAELEYLWKNPDLLKKTIFYKTDASGVARPVPPPF
jgi:RHS repeat-associated protein